ncbi:beta-ketoacyl-ACP synthase [Lacimicrobium sp. SS2-24]|uniref:beta-ketoacyl-ACP synthase n=1 Tax=Lacimicrobium sp. SS2-24 TaxID=2005569 RepID=UPI000B4B334B|nr:beta-ketoacyl-ACP synthase [Lacimicrobium sp. SS2-24]
MVFLNQLGITCSLGMSKKEVIKHLLNPGERQSYLTLNRELGLEDQEYYVGQARGDLPNLADYPLAYHSRNNQLALSAYRQIEAEVQQLRQSLPDERIGVIIGTSTSGISDGEIALRKRQQQGQWPQDYHYSKQEMGAVSEFVAHLSQAKGPCYSLSTACSSSGKALLSARNLIESGFVDAVICGGVDSLSRLPVNGFAALEAMAETFTQPFKAGRDGINIGEAAALFVMTREAQGIALLGGGESTDAHHISAPQPEGEGALSAMRAALSDAQISAEQLDYINAHGTGTPLNDAMESQAIYKLVADQVPVSSTKELTGHTLGAAGALEAGLCWLLLSPYNTAAKLPVSVASGEADPSLAPIRYCDGAESDVRLCLSNSFAFGGNNVSLILGTVSHNDRVTRYKEAQ